MVNLFDRKRETQTQQFIKIYQGLKSQGALDEQKIFQTAVELLQEQRAQAKTDAQESLEDFADSETSEPSNKVNLAKDFAKAQQANSTTESSNAENRKSNIKTSTGINIENLFKD